MGANNWCTFVFFLCKHCFSWCTHGFFWCKQLVLIWCCLMQTVLFLMHTLPFGANSLVQTVASWCKHHPARNIGANICPKGANISHMAANCPSPESPQNQISKCFLMCLPSHGAPWVQTFPRCVQTFPAWVQTLVQTLGPKGPAKCQKAPRKSQPVPRGPRQHTGKDTFTTRVPNQRIHIGVH